MRNRIQTFVQGLVMGTTEVIPGVSSSTLALVMGIYEKYVEFLFEISEAVKGTLAKLAGKRESQSLVYIWQRVSWSFGLTLGLGMIVAILSLAKVLAFLLEVNENAVFAFFFGLVLGAISLPFRKISHISWKIGMIAAFTTMCFFTLFSFVDPLSVQPPLWLFFVGGVLGVSAMILPGVSGSFVLVLVGVYKPAIQLVSEMLELQMGASTIIPLGVLMLGVIIGFLLFIRVVRYALQTYHDVLMAFLGGLMIASLRSLWPFTSSAENSVVPAAPWSVSMNEMILFGILIILGALTVLGLQKYNRTVNNT